jgi:hypothetical protein
MVKFKLMSSTITRPIRESSNKGNRKTRPQGAKPVATPKPQGQPMPGQVSNGSSSASRRNAEDLELASRGI